MDNLKHLNGYVEETDDEVTTTDRVNAVKAEAKHSRSTYYPTCRFCGSQTLPDATYESQEQADEAATMRCNCVEARIYQDKCEKEKQRQDNINKLRYRLDEFTEYCDGRGVELSGGLYDTIFNAGVAVLDGIIAQASFKFVRMKVNISINSKNVLVIAFTYSDGAKMEV